MAATHRTTHEAERSILDDLGEEVTGVIWPVAICMAVTVLLVKLLNPQGQSSGSTMILASAGYDESANVRGDCLLACAQHLHGTQT